jgi:hypothetical protein
MASSDGLIRTGGFSYIDDPENPNDDLKVVISNFTFSNITFVNGGNLMNLGHMMNSYLVIQDSTFVNLNTAVILIASSITQDSSVKTKVQILNSKFDQFYSFSGSLITAYEGSVIEIKNSTFTNLSTLSRGAAITAGNKQADVTIYDSVFMNNSANEGAIFNIEQESIVKCHNCTISNNYALRSGVVKIDTSGYFEFYDSVITRNFAKSNPISLLFDWVNLSIINHWEIHDNYMRTIEDMEQEFNSGCQDLCFIGEMLKNDLISNKEFYSQDVSSGDLMQLVLASIKITNSTHIHHEDALINSFLSTVTIEDSTISDIDISDISIEAVSSTLIFTGMNLQNITNNNNGDFILVSLESNFTFSDIVYKDSNSILFNLRSSDIVASNLMFLNIVDARNLFIIYDSIRASINEMQTINSNSADISLISIRNSNDVSFGDITLDGIDQIVFNIERSFVIEIKNITISNSQKVFLVQDSKIDMIRDSTFSNNGKKTNYKGGAIEMMDSHIYIVNSTFINNTAESGAGIYFDWSSLSLCDLVISNSTFELNRATSKGGGIFYNYRRPTLNSINNVNNSAPYGPDLASYAVKIRMQGSNSDSMVLNNVGPNVVIGTFSLELLDYDNQVMVLNNINQIAISSVNLSEATIQGTNAALLKEGVGKFDLLKSLAVPGTRGAKMRASSKAINSAKIIQVYGSIISENLITFNFRNCIPGEHIQNTNRWVQWSPRTFSLKWNSNSWIDCIENASCEGKEMINVDKEHWRFSTNSTKVVECIKKDAWEGGYFPKNEHPVQCKEGYGGILCSECQIVNGEKYQKVNDFECTKCMNPVLNALSVIAAMIIVFCFFMIMIVINVRKTKESEVSVLMRILTNYIQLITFSFAYSSSFPNTLFNFLIPAERVGSSADTFLSFDWFVEDYELKGPFPSNTLFKIFLTAFLPIILTAIVGLFWTFIHFFKKQWAIDLKRCIIISFISIVFILHPKLTENSLSILRWVDVDEEDRRMRIDTSIEWYSSEHWQWITLLSLPILSVWVVGAPLTGFILLYKNIKKGRSNQVNQYLLILYQGLRHDRFYWEFVNTLRKTIFLALLLLTDIPKIFCGMILLVVSMRLQNYLNPFRDEENNGIEIKALFSGIIILGSALVFQEEESFGVFETFAILLIVGVNLYFLLDWMYKLLLTSGKKYHAVKLVKFI